jgi:hypothetical protein
MQGRRSQELLVGLVLMVPYFFASVGLVPYVASEKRRSSFGWILTAFFLTPLLALIALAALSTGEEDVPVNRFDLDREKR